MNKDGQYRFIRSKMVKIDSLDKEIAKLLAQDARQSKEVLANKLKVSPATIGRRITKLINSNVLRIIGVIDTQAFGIPLAVWISLDIDYDKLAMATEILEKQPEIRIVSETSGRFDLVAFGRFQSNAHISQFMARVMPQIEGVKDRETIVCLDSKKHPFVAYQ